MDMIWLDRLPQDLRREAERLIAASALFASLLRKMPEDEAAALFRPVEEARLPDGGTAWVPHCDSDDLRACMHHLRRCKQRGLRHIIWWEMGVRGDIEASFTAIADFAAGLLNEALSMARRLIAPRFGSLEGGRFCIIGLGKLGGRELNLGSDVDPLFIWDGEGPSRGGRKQVSAAEYFNQLSRMLIRLMSEPTEDGLVWPVDMRLRPGGEGAPLAMSLDATLDFYQNYGQTWERAMLIKARPVAGDTALGEAFIEGVAPFVYRRYLDYTTVAALADMKRRIDLQAGGKHAMGPGFDVKRGRGGIREIEFIIQSRQLLHGASIPELRVPSSLAALAGLRRFGILDEGEATRLAEAYRFWRRVEHAVQARRGEQTQKLPEDYESYLELMLGVPNIQAEMEKHARVVRDAFARHILPVGEAEAESGWLINGAQRLPDSLDENARRRIAMALERIDAQLLRGILPERSRRYIEIILSRAMPRWLEDHNGVTAIESFAELVHTIAGRATWIDLLATHEGALNWLIGALSASRYLAEHIARDPSWLEWPLLSEQHATDIADLCRRLVDTGKRVDDLEQALREIGRQVDQGRIMTALAIDAHQADPLKVGEWMSMLADAATEAVWRLCRGELKLPEDFPLVAVAMGKHGSREMGLVSDLDMVFVLDCDDLSAMIGKRTYGEYARRFGRRMIQYLTASPPYGAGFKFDARLRPSGESGVLVTSLKGFRDYQLHHAQTWEHQALCRARAVAGPDACRQAVDAVVSEILDLPRDRKALAADVIAMREKMLAHLASKSDAVINLKQDAGGLVDIEFLAQFARLAFKAPGRRTVDILNAVAAVDAPEAWKRHHAFLVDTYIAYRQMENALRVELWRSIGRLPATPEATEWETMRRHASIHSPEALRARMRQTHRLFKELLSLN